MVTYGERSTDHLPDVDERITRWVHDVWDIIKRQVLQDYRYEILIDPAFTDPGTCIYWQPRTITHPSNLARGEDTVEVIHEPTPLPCNTAAQVHQRLAKGCLLQPPMMESVRYVPDYTPPEVPPDNPDFKFWHKSGKDIYNFPTWDGYVKFCNFRGIPLNKDLCPDEVKERLESAPYHCFQHNLAFPNRDLALMHWKTCKLPGRRVVYQSVDEMKSEQQVGESSPQEV